MCVCVCGTTVSTNQKWELAAQLCYPPHKQRTPGGDTRMEQLPFSLDPLNSVKDYLHWFCSKALRGTTPAHRMKTAMLPNVTSLCHLIGNCKQLEGKENTPIKCQGVWITHDIYALPNQVATTLSTVAREDLLQYCLQVARFWLAPHIFDISQLMALKSPLPPLDCIQA